MSEEEDKSVTFEEFKEFFDRHPDMDNAEYYAEFPGTNKSTIRSWKSRLASPPPTTPETKDTGIDYTALEEQHIKLLISQTKSDYREFEGMDNKSKIMVLQNRLKIQESDKSNKRTPNSSILPAPKPPGQGKEFGIDEYIVFDKDKDEIRMSIPIEVLHDPKKNKGLGLIKR